MLRRNERLARSRDVEAVRRRGRTKRNQFFTVRTLSTPGQRVSRATVVVSKRVSKRAVDRNRLKRQVRALLVPLLRSRATPIDVTISIQAAALNKTSKQLGASLSELLS